MDKKKRNTVFILISMVLIFVVLIVVSANSKSNFRGFYKFVSYPFVKIQEAFSSVGSSISNKINFLKEYDDLTEKIRNLEEENQNLNNAKSENEILKAENEELRKLLELKEYYDDYKTVAANIIAKDVTDWYNELTLDVGSKDGISKGDPVITAEGLVGIVTLVGTDSCKIMTIADEQNVIMARILRNNELVRVTGVSSENYTYELQMDRIDANADIYVGDVVITAESGGTYPKGITLGVISEIYTINGTETRFATVVPAVHLTTISEVIVLTD